MRTQDFMAKIAGDLSQHDRLVTLDTKLGPDTLLPQRVVGRSRLGRHFEFTVDVVSAASNVELKMLIAQPVTLWIRQSDKSRDQFHRDCDRALCARRISDRRPRQGLAM